MYRVIYIEAEYRIIKITEHSYVVANTYGGHGMHAHIAKRSTAQKLIKLVRSKTVPRSDYLKTSALRISMDKRYKQQITAALPDILDSEEMDPDGDKGVYSI